MRETEPFEDPDRAQTLQVLPSFPDGGALHRVEIAGELAIDPDGVTRLLKILDDHEELHELVTHESGTLRVVHGEAEIDATAWVAIRRGLLLCASQAYGGAITVTSPGLWVFEAHATGSQPQPARANTAKLLTGRTRRPGPGRRSSD